jgi:stage II sporulation protein D
MMSAAGLATTCSCTSTTTTRAPDVTAPPVVRQPPARHDDTDIRLLIVEGVDRFDLSVAGPCRVTDSRGRTVRAFPGGIAPQPVFARPDGVSFNQLQFAWLDRGSPAPGGEIDEAPEYAAGRATAADGSAVAASSGTTWLEIVPDSPGATLAVAGKRYRGRLRIIRDGGAMTAVNVLDIEDYLPGVLRGETPANWQLEAYKAQAVASRTFALYEKARRGPALYDVRPTVASQVYLAGEDGDPVLRRAVAETRGQVLTIDGGLVHAYFCSTCGGMNEPAVVAWPREPMNQALGGGSACSFCQISPRWRWGPINWSKTALLAKLRRKDAARFGPGFGELLGVEVASRVSRSGRPAELRVVGSGGAVPMSAYDFRLWVSEGEPRERQLFSSFFEVADGGATLSFTGRGFGHGVGLCQWGAEGQARARRDYRQILALYYPGSRLSTVR